MKNIVFILMDQLRADFLGCYGATHLNTPNIDKLATESVRYEHTISPSPLCVPARASLLTGRSSLANRVIENSSWIRPDHDDMGIYTWPKQLSNKGYYTCAIGKMHFYPWDISEGFDERVIAEDKRHIHIKDDYNMFLESKGYRRMHGNEFDGYFEHQGAIINTLPEELQIDHYVAQKSLDIINTLDENKPFALMVGFPGPHCPYDPTKDMLNHLPDKKIPEPLKPTKESESFREFFVKNNSYDWNGVDYSDFKYENKMMIRKHYSALIETLDSHIGTIVEALKAKELYEDTVIIVSADHGDMMGDFDLLAKHFFYETSIRVPLLIKYPGQKATVVSEITSLTDLYGTIKHFADIEHIDTVDSKVLKPFGSEEIREPVFGATDIGWMIRDSRYKYCICDNTTEMLFDLQEDPSEQINLVLNRKYESIKESMRQLLYKRLFNGILEGNNDLVVTGADLDSGFFERNWMRPYPKDSSVVRKIK